MSDLVSGSWVVLVAVSIDWESISWDGLDKGLLEAPIYYTTLHYHDFIRVVIFEDIPDFYHQPCQSTRRGHDRFGKIHGRVGI